MIVARLVWRMRLVELLLWIAAQAEQIELFDRAGSGSGTAA